jgi:hypothetical protein
MKQGSFPRAGLCCPAPSSGTTTPSDCLSATRHFPASGYRRALLPEPRRFGAEEALSSSHDTLLTVPRPLRRRVLGHPLQAPRCRPWPSPLECRLGSLLARSRGDSLRRRRLRLMLRTGQLRRAPPRPRDLARRRGPRYRGPWRLPGPDSHRLAAVSLSLGYVVVLLLTVVLGARAAGRTFRRNRDQLQRPHCLSTT